VVRVGFSFDMVLLKDKNLLEKGKEE